MIIEFSITNFRSVREKQMLSLVASSTTAKSNNTFDMQLASGESLTLLKTIGIYGHNSFGKSNIIRALFNFLKLIRVSADYKVGDTIEEYEPYLFNTASKVSDTNFELLFVAKEANTGLYQKYKYSVSFNAKKITKEELVFYPEKKSNTIFKRNTEHSGIVHKAKMGKRFAGKEHELYENQLLLSKFGGDIANDYIAPLFLYITSIDIWNVVDAFKLAYLRRSIIRDLEKTENETFFSRLNKMVKLAVPSIEALVLNDIKEVEETNLPDNLPDKTRQKIRRANETLFARHFVYDENKEIVGTHDLPFSEESVGTNCLFALGGLVLQKLEKGGIIFFDEFDTSLHPILSRFLVQLVHLYHRAASNPNSAQLVFSSHEVHILDRNTMRSDQIWFVDKNAFGETQLYSANDFEGIREDIPFDKWYLAGKFGAIPKLQDSDIHTVFD